MKSFILCIFISMTAFAGPVHIGNGGNAIKILDKLYLLDLAEQGIAENPVFKDTVQQPYYEYFRARTNSNSTIPSAILELFSHKLAEIAELDPVYAEALVTAFENVRWTFINYRLNDIPVDSIVAGPYYQIASRTNDIILIDLFYWQQLNPANRVALLIHELNYILIYPQKNNETAEFEKSAFKSRLQTGYLFSQKFQLIDSVSFSKRIQLLFPSRYTTKINHNTFFPFTFKTYENSRMGFNPYLLINGDIPSSSLANVTAEHFKSNLCLDKDRGFRSLEVMAKVVNQDIYNGDNNSQDVTTFIDYKIPNFTVTRLPNETCNNAAERAYNEINQLIPGLFYTP